MSGPMEEEFQPTWCQSWSVSDLCVVQFDAPVAQLGRSCIKSRWSLRHQLRIVVAELRRERSALKTQFAKRAGSGKDLSSVMGTLIDDADANLKSGSSRFNPC